MTNAEIIRAIRTEIERRKKEIHATIFNDEFDSLLSFLSTLESEKPINQDGLEEEINRTYHNGSVADTSDLDHNSYENIARHFYDLGCTRTAEKYDEIEYNRQRAEESPLPEDTVLFNKGVEEGRRLAEEEQADLFTIVALDAAQRAKEQMMKEAVEGLFQNTPFPTICLDDCKDYNFKDNQKVRIIIVKED